MLPKALHRQTVNRHGVKPGRYALLTLHRPSNVDDLGTLSRLLDLFADLSQKIPILFPVHPRTRKQITSLGYTPPADFRLIEPVDYLDSLCLQKQAKLVLTDSGGIQEETSYLDVPCLTLRKNTERPITLELGTSTLVGNDVTLIRNGFEQVLAGQYKHGKPIPLWDGHAAERIAQNLQDLLQRI